MNQENSEKAVDTYDQFVGAEVCLPYELGRTIMVVFTKRVKYNKIDPRGIEHPTFFEDHSLYEVSFSNGRTEELAANVISENMISQVDSEGHHYHVLKEISYHYAYGSALKGRYIFIRSRGRNLHAKNTIRGCKL